MNFLTNSVSSPRGSNSVLLIGPVENNQKAAYRILASCGWNLHSVPTRKDAMSFLRKNPVSVVICERELADGDWKVVLDDLAVLPSHPVLIVSSRLADEHLWAEVLNLGGYDLLPTPFDPSEISRVVALASGAWQHARQIAETSLDTRCFRATPGAYAGPSY